jgi:hypothetical protein
MKIAAIAFIWLIVAFLAGASGILASLNTPLPQLILLGLVFILLLGFWRIPRFRIWSLGVDIKVFLLFNLVRFVGVYFLILYSEGRLPYDFAVPGGWGDIVIAVLAAVLILFVPAGEKNGFRVYFIWNLLGLIDILFVVATASRLALANPDSMSELLKLPLSLLPTFIVPILIYIHIILFIRLHKSRKKGYGVI